MTDDRHILFFDGECVMCNGIVKWLFAHDPDKRFEYASLQGETAAEFRERHDEFPAGLETFVYYDGGQIRLRSEAAFSASRLLRAPWRWVHLLRFLPRFLGNLVYDFVAQNRIKWFGRTESCWLPPKEEQHRFLA